MLPFLTAGLLQFVALLNAKKERLAALKHEVEELRHERLQGFSRVCPSMLTIRARAPLPVASCKRPSSPDRQPHRAGAEAVNAGKSNADSGRGDSGGGEAEGDKADRAAPDHGKDDTRGAAKPAAGWRTCASAHDPPKEGGGGEWGIDNSTSLRAFIQFVGYSFQTSPST